MMRFGTLFASPLSCFKNRTGAFRLCLIVSRCYQAGGAFLATRRLRFTGFQIIVGISCLTATPSRRLCFRLARASNQFQHEYLENISGVYPEVEREEDTWGGRRGRGKRRGDGLTRRREVGGASCE